ncbi:NAD(P)/FAD-dependent oxidoreductase [Salipiger mucosus]|uniref:Oxidoreductase n=1 Tax=Salipiger mucosus DSM 16094 TaxID=1123237 RepID=S9S3N5_9RHOB|nr:FAD-binding oxidoreductase [Salipiger mucosus]EPX84810.1 oxidoreductase [Salipiger mucosus DSM 16094]
MTRFSPISDCLWPKTAAPSPFVDDLAETVEADVCIVGGGFCGLHTALQLSREGKNVVVLEAEEIGFGGSGRNAGHCTPTFHHHSLDEIRQLLGPTRGEKLIHLQTTASHRIGDVIKEHDIACEWVQNGYVMAAPTPGKLPSLRAKAESYNAVGQNTEVKDAGEIAALTGMRGQHGGWFHPGGAHLNPMGLARGLATAARKHGADIYVKSPVMKAERAHGRWTVSTPRGSVRATKLIYTTGAYTRDGWPKLSDTFKIMRVMVAATKPMPEADSVLPSNVTAHDGRGNILVYKRDAFGRIVASMFPRMFATREKMLDLMSRRLRFHHPDLPEQLEWDCLWTGELDMQSRTIPRLYHLGDNAVAVTGLSGRGVPTGYTVGQVLSDWANERPADDLALPLEPLSSAPAYMAFAPQLALRGFEARDRLAEWRSGEEMRPW